MSGNLYISPILAKLWGKGMVTVGAVTLESAAYVARYCTKRYLVMMLLSIIKGVSLSMLRCLVVPVLGIDGIRNLKKTCILVIF